MNLFGRKKKPAPVKIGNSILKLKEANVRLDKREVHLNNLITECLKQAKAKAAKKEKKQHYII